MRSRITSKTALRRLIRIAIRNIMTTPQETTLPPVRRCSGQGEEVAFASLYDAIRQDPIAGDLDQRIIDQAEHVLAEVDGRLMLRFGTGGAAYVGYCWREELSGIAEKAGAPCTVVRVLPEWRFTVEGMARLAIENDRERDSERMRRAS